MSPKEKLREFAALLGVGYEWSATRVALTGVECNLSTGEAGKCTIETARDAESGVGVQGDREEAPHAVRITTTGEGRGTVHEADGDCVGNWLNGDNRHWSAISLMRNHGSETAEEQIYRYARQIDGAHSERTHRPEKWGTRESVFHIPETHEGRAGLKGMNDRVREQKVAVIGLGGTGAFVLDMLAKTGVREIHIVDDDKMESHNIMRCPGGLSEQERTELLAGSVTKTEFYCRRYENLRTGIIVRNMRATNGLGEELRRGGVDFAFVSIDQTDEGRQDEVYATLQEANIAFVDSGISVRVENGQITEAGISSNLNEKGGDGWRETVPNIIAKGDGGGYHNAQLVELNVVAAALAIIEWRRYMKQYASTKSTETRRMRINRVGVDILER